MTLRNDPRSGVGVSVERPPVSRQRLFGAFFRRDPEFSPTRQAVFSSAFALVLLVVAADLPAQEACKSGLAPGVRPGPYAAVMVTGQQRGQSFCYICDTADKPAVIIFARTMSDELGKLAHALDKALATHKSADLRAWITVLHEDQASVDAKIVQWAKQHAVGTVPIGVFEDVVGPPSYRLAREADVTVLLSVKQKVVGNFAFRAGELTDARIADVLKALPDLVKK
jgi:hypothetical protein